MFGAPANNSPFGSPPPTGGFGSPSPAPFGAPAPAFGAPAFGTPAPAPAFGAPSTGFGAPAPAPGGFGASTFGGGATSTFGGGGFGAPAPAPAFGGGGFGATNNASPFGAPAPAPGGLFGAPAPAPSGGLFGAPAPAPAFGASPAPAFGASTFGAPAPTPAFGASTFGAPAPSTGLFGAAPTPAPSAFGSTFGASPAPAFGAPAPPPGSIFGGAPAPAPGGLFGAPAAAAPGQPGGGGSKQTPYQPTPRQDGTSTIQMQSISAMPAYENKNFDELRYEDYLQGNKGAGNAASTGFGGFGAPAPSGGLFGATPAPAFGAPSTSPFGAPAPAPFGAPAPAPFGAPAPAFGSTFGAPAPAPPAFGATPAPAFGSSTFGKPATGSLFGAPAPAQGGLFGGGSPAAAPAFGAPAPAPGGLFGAPAPAPGGLFGAPAPGGLFGSTPAPAFGAPAPPPAFGFGAPAPGGGLFGPAPAPAFGATPAPGGLFGAPAPPAGSLFGAKPPGTGLFGAPAPAAFGSPPTAFGAPTAAAPSLFGSPPAMAAAPMMIPAGAIIPQAASEVLSHQIQALENKRKEVQKLDVWRTKSPEESRVTPVSQPQYGGLASGLVRSSPYTPHRHNPGSAAKKLRPRGFGSAIAAPSSSASPLDTMGTGGRAMMSPEAYVSSSAKKLVIKQDSLTPKPKLQLRLMNAPSSASDVTTHALPVSLEAESPAPGNAGPSIATAPPASSPSPRQSQMQTSTPTSVPVFGNEANAGTPTSPTVNGGSRIPPVTAEKIDPPPPDPDRDYYQQVVDSPDGNPADRPAPQSARVTKKKPSYLPKLTKPGYVITPSLDELATLSEADLAAVSNFSIRCDPYGLVEWKGAVDVRNADLDNSIVIGQNDVSVYTKDEEEGRKPPVGSKLNRPAVITFFNVFPKNGGANASVEDKVKFARRIERQTVKMDAELIKYDKDTGSWKIAVGHFSRYGLSDDDESEDELYTESVEKEDDAAIVSDVEMDHHVEEAFDSIYSAVKSYSKHPKTSLHDDMELSEEQTDDCDFDEYYESPDCRSMGFSTTLISADDYDKATKQHATTGICNRMSTKAFASERRVPKNVEYGLRLGRSHGICWSPNGSFLKVAQGGTKLEQRRPVFENAGGKSAWNRSKQQLEAHRQCSSKLPTEVDDRSPRFVLPRSVSNGDAKSHEALHQALVALQGNPKGEDIGSLSFALLACLVDDDATVTKPSMDLRKEAVIRFLVDALKTSTDRGVDQAMARNDVLAAVHAALKGGNLSKACEISVAAGQEDLAACIATFDMEGSADIAAQARKATTNEGLRKIYSLLSSGSSNKGGEQEWMTTLLIKLLYGSPLQDISLPKVLESFQTDIKTSQAPYPSPSYIRGGRERVQSILFRLLRLTESPQLITCAEVINPDGISRFHHDFSVSFFLASALASAGICSSLSVFQEERVIDGYCTQLIGMGHWEWAVYVCLCSLNHDVLESTKTEWKQAKAKRIVLQFYHRADPHFNVRNNFLSEIGVPQEWCSEAFAHRSASVGDPFSYINHLVSFSTKQAMAVCDQVILPNILFMGNSDVDKCMELLRSCQGDLSPTAKAVLSMLEIGQDLQEMATAPQEIDKQMLSEMKAELDMVEKKLHLELSKCKKGFPPLQFSAFSAIPLPSMLSEALDHCVFLSTLLKALELGIHVGTKTSQRKLTALLAFNAIGGHSECTSSAALLR